MRTCMIQGDMTSDKSSEAYPVETFCDDCYEAMAPGTEDSPVVQDQGYDPSWGQVCADCGKTEEEELEEQSL